MVIENSELKLLLPPPGGSKGFAGAARPVSSSLWCLPSQLWWAAECVRNRKHLPNVEAAFALDEAKGTLHPPHFAKERLRENYS